jgi:hypothetical protein
MKLGLMQPYFFPYLGYFDLINRTDKWIVFDTAQYIQRGWMNRNRILHPQKSWQYIVVPLRKHALDTPIDRIETLPPAEWRPRILGQLMHYKRHAPFFRTTLELVEECLATEEVSLARLNVRVLGCVCARLEIPWNHDCLSQLQLPLDQVSEPGDWALEIATKLRASEYLNPPGGAGLYDSERFAARGIKLTIQPPFEFNYPTPGFQFEPGLSVIDALMWNSPAAIKAHLDRNAVGAVPPLPSS